jgi:hypothetical protein
MGATRNEIRDALPDDTLWQEVQGFAGAMWSDMVTPAGLPIMTLSKENFEQYKTAPLILETCPKRRDSVRSS